MTTKQQTITNALDIFGIKHDDSPAYTHLLQDLKLLSKDIEDSDLMNYYAARLMVFDWIEKHSDNKRFGGKPTKKGNALYYYKQAMKFGDLEAALRYLKKYYKFGGVKKETIQQAKHAHPLSSIPMMKRIVFRKSLTDDQEVVLKAALAWYNKTYK